jgi:hypothetical protein
MIAVRILKGALDEIGDSIVLRGVVHPDSLRNLKVAGYQREVLPKAAHSSLVHAYRKGDRVPDIELGMRGSTYREENGVFILEDDVYIIDGLQRTSAAKYIMSVELGLEPRIGCLVHFGTTEEWERKRFRLVNTTGTKLSPGILIKTLLGEYPAFDMLYHLTFDRDFCLHGRVCWAQRMEQKHLIQGLTYCKTVGILHAHAGPGRAGKVEALGAGLSKTMAKVGRIEMRENTKNFFKVMDDAWGLHRIVFKEGATYIKSNFLRAMAMLFSRHYDFWEGEESKLLSIDRAMLSKISSFPVDDPQVIRLSGSSSSTAELLYRLIVDHFNSGKRTKRLTPRGQWEAALEPEEETDADAQKSEAIHPSKETP